MRHAFVAFAFLVLPLSLSPCALAQPDACNAMTVGQLTNLNGFVPFPASSLWNTDISAAPVDPNSANIIDYIGVNVTLHPDFGAGLYAHQSIGIPYQVVTGSQRKVTVKIAAYPDENDPGPMPIPANALIEGYPRPGNSDAHVLVLEKDNCWLYELDRAFRLPGGNWRADSTAIWDMTIDAQRPYTWTSADAAGLPILTGLVRYDEVAAGAINHALRFTVPRTRHAFTPPASHWASSISDADAPPMGMKLRLKSSFDSSSFSPQNQVILIALKNYGMILADNGSGIYISGAPDKRWNNDDLGNLKTITASDFEVVSMDPVYTDSNLPTGAAPTISSFIASQTSIKRGTPIILSWMTSDAIYNLISPVVGPIRGDSITVNPGSTTTYTLYSTNQFGRTTASVTVAVH